MTAPIIIVSIAVYMVATMFVTEVLKKFVGGLPRQGRGALIMSWIVGGLMFWAMYALAFLPAGLDLPLAVMAFVVLTGAVNGAYKIERIKSAVKEFLK